MKINLINFFKFFDEKNPNHIKAVTQFQNSLPDQYVDDSCEWVETYRTKVVEDYTSQLPMPGVELIKQFEGCRLKSYYDPLSGRLPITIGWGSTRRKDGSVFLIGQTITQQEADDLLLYQLSKDYLPSLQKIPHWNEMNDNQKGALLSFAYNLGAGFYGSDDFSSITRVLRNKEWDLVPDAMYRYRNPGTSVESGLARRRIMEGNLWSK